MTQSIKLMRMAFFVMLLISFTMSFTVHPGYSGKRARFVHTRHRMVDTADVNIELAQMQAAYAGPDHLSFDVNASEITTTGGIPVLATETLHYKINGNKYYIKGDSSIQIQDSNYHMTVLDNLQMITIAPTNYSFQTLLMLDVLNPDFQRDNVQGMTVKDTSFMRRISFQFYRESAIKSLSILYDTGTYKLETISGSMSTRSAVPADSAADLGQQISVNMQFVNYQFGMFGDSVFNTSRYYSRQRDSFVFVAPYNTYQFVNSTLD